MQSGCNPNCLKYVSSLEISQGKLREFQEVEKPVLWNQTDLGLNSSSVTMQSLGKIA